MYPKAMPGGRERVQIHRVSTSPFGFQSMSTYSSTICSTLTKSCNSEAYCRGAMHQDVNDKKEGWSVDKEEMKEKEEGKERENEKETNVKVKRNWRETLRNWKRKGRKPIANNPAAVSKLPYGQGEMQDIILR